MVSPENGGNDNDERETQLVERAHASARALARRMVRGKQRADDIAQDVALDLLRRMRAGKGVKPQQMDAYVATIVLRRRSDTRLRRRRGAARDWTYLNEIAADRRAWMDPEAQREELELQALYRRTLDSLPPRCRQAFIAVREDGQSYLEAASALGVSVKMIAKLITEAQRVFRRVLREQGIRVPREKGWNRRMATGFATQPAQPQISDAGSGLSISATFVRRRGKEATRTVDLRHVQPSQETPQCAT